MVKASLLVWEEDFPEVYGQTSISFLKNCPGYMEAKNGDINAALQVAKMCMNTRTVKEIKQKHPDAVLLPVVTNNKLPEAVARVIGMKIHTGVYMHKTLNRKTLTAMERLVHKPVFGGKITAGKSYILVDDIVTQGGTVSALRKYVIRNGGTVAAIVTLSYSAGSKVMTPNQKDIFRLTKKFNFNSITEILRHYNIAQSLCELTNSQIKYLLLFKELDVLKNKIEKTHESINMCKLDCVPAV